MAAWALQKLLARQPRGRRPRRPRSSTPGSARPSSLLVVRPERRRRLELDRPRRRERPLLHARGWSGRSAWPGRPATWCPTTFQQGRGLSAQPGCDDRRRRLRDQGHSAARPGGGRAGRLRPGQPALPRAAALSPAALAYLALALGGNGPQADGRRSAGSAGQAQPRRIRRRRLASRSGRRRLAAVEPVAGRVAGPVCPGGPGGRAARRPRPRS